VERQIEYEAGSDAEAIQVAKDRLGREAVILSSRPVKRGGFMGFFKRDALLITAGLLVPDQEDLKRESQERMVAFQHLLDVRRAVGGNDSVTQQTEKRPDEPFLKSAFATPGRAAAAAYEANAKPQPAANSLTKDVDEIKDILSKVLLRLNGEAGEEKPPAEDGNVKKLLSVDVDRDIADAIAREFMEKEPGAPFEEWLADTIPVMGTDTSSALGGKKILFAGPTGVGKTTTIAKIASTQSLWEDKRVVLMTADTYRIAAVEQLRTYAKILGIPIEIVPDARDLRDALKRHGDADLILLDTAGRSHYDGGRIDELHALYEAFAPDCVHLVMASNVKYRDMLNIIERMGVVPLSSLLFTKLDETSSCGTILNILRDFNLPLSFFTMGQNVPNDIEVARSERFVNLLLKTDVIGQE
jgi:flagellar biosynthesis protein FlhF